MASPSSAFGPYCAVSATHGICRVWEAPEILCFRVQVASRFASPGRLWFETPPSAAPHHEDRFDRPHPEGAPKGRAIATAIARGVTLAFQVSARTVRLSSAR